MSQKEKAEVKIILKNAATKNWSTATACLC